VVHALVQQLADLEATQRHQSPRAVPRLSTDLAIPDQLTVMARDLLVEPSDSQVLAEAAAAVEAIRQRVAE
jgi:hypothetical protein